MSYSSIAILFNSLFYFKTFKVYFQSKLFFFIDITAQEKSWIYIYNIAIFRVFNINMKADFR
ncbi:hypothetical protein THZG08_130067 [Vibrio owensii]|nr:hypothetical protein THZG08_130067 [Vibrio owensii]CAH1551294.1 hypothetical protein THOA03_130067 [Vibrio owensii]